MSNDLTREHLRHFVPFDTLPATHLDQILGKAKLLSMPAGKILFKRGEVAKQCFYLLSGSVDLSDYQFNLTRVCAGTEEAAHALDNVERHTRSAITKETSAVLVVDRDQLDLVMTWDQAGEYVVTELGESEDPHNDWMQHLLRSDLFMQIPPANIQQLFSRFEKRVAHDNEIIIRQGDTGDHFYVIAQGSVKITRHGAWGQIDVGTLGSGQFFGEEALVGDTLRNATVTMTSDGVLMCLGKHDFERLLRDPLVKSINEFELGELRRKDPVRIIDVRLRWEYNLSHLEGAENLPLKDLRRKIDALPKDGTWVLTCDGGRRSELGAYLFRESGRKAVVFKP
jgi:CRP-like cAMP-binding protein